MTDATARGIRAFAAEVGELIARRDARPAGADFRRYRDDPHGFIRNVLRVDLVPQQIALVADVRDNPMNAVAAGVAMGKDHVAACLALWWTFARGGLVLLSSATERQVNEIGLGEVRHLWNRAELPGDFYASGLRIGGDHARSGILGFVSSAHDSGKWTGHHSAGGVLVILSEAQSCPDAAYEGALSCTAGADDRVLAIGNPLFATGRFATLERAKHWRFHRWSALEHPNVIEGRTVVPGAVTREAIAKFAAEYGEDSPIYRARVLGLFPLDDPNAQLLVRREWIEAAMERWERGGMQGDDTGAWTAALDVARMGADSSCLAVRQEMTVRELVTWKLATTDATAARTVAELRARGIPTGRERVYDVNGCPVPPARIVVDSTGVGAGVFDMLRRDRHNAHEFVAAGRAREPDRFANQRAEAAWTLRGLLERDLIALPPVTALSEELAALRWQVDGNGRVQLEDKALLRGRLGRSPDHADAVMMAFSNVIVSDRQVWGQGRWTF